MPSQKEGAYIYGFSTALEPEIGFEDFVDDFSLQDLWVEEEAARQTLGKCWFTHVYVYVYTYTCAYIYICTCICICIYIYMCKPCVYVYIYIYVYMSIDIYVYRYI